MKSPFPLKITTLNNMELFTVRMTKTLKVGSVIHLKCLTIKKAVQLLRSTPVM